MKTNLIHTLLLGTGALLAAQSASAAITWNLGSTISTTATNATVNTSYDGLANGFGVGNTRTSAGNVAGAPTVTASAWSNTGNNTSTSTGNSGAYTLESAYLANYSGGLGVKNRDASVNNAYGDYNEGNTPEHAVDNNQRTDAVLFNFSSAIKLTSMSIGYWSGDSDVSVLAYTGAGAPTLAGAAYGDLVGAGGGWTLIGHYADLANNTPMSINAGGVSSSYWLIGAYNAYVGGSALTNGNDNVKLLALAGDLKPPPPPPGNQVPEPGTLGLLGLGLLGMMRLHHKARAA